MHEIRYAIRTVRRSPGFTAAAVLTLALGIGANTAVFSVFDAALLRPLSYGNADRLVALGEARRSGPMVGIPPGRLAIYQSARSFDAVAAFDRTSLSLTRSGTPEQVLGEAVTWNLLPVVGVSPIIGRGFRQDEDRPGGDRVVILMHAFWVRRFGADPAILGRMLILNDEPHAVIGVMPPTFEPLSQPGSGFRIDFLVPAAYSEDVLSNRTVSQVSLVARLAPDTSIEQARTELSGISADLARRFPETNREIAAVVAPLRDRFIRRNMRQSLIVMLGAVGLVLLVACVNLGNLLLVRAVGQRREIAVRLALGATRARVTLDLAIRGLVLGLLGGIAGLLAGVWMRGVVIAVAPPWIPGLDRAALNPRVLMVTCGLSLSAGLAAGLLPSIQWWRRNDTARTLRATSPTSTAATATWRGLLTAVEIAAALVLTVAAGLLLRTLLTLTRVELGFRTDNVLMFTVRPPAERYPDQAARWRLFEEIERRLKDLAGVQSVGITDALPLRGGARIRVGVADRADVSGTADFQVVSPGYFPALRIALSRGRLFGSGDRSEAEHVAVVSAEFVRRFLPGRDPIGQRIRLGASSTRATIVGVVADVRRDGPETVLAPQVYVPAAQSELYPGRLAEVAIRTPGDPLALVPEIQRIVASVDPDQPITHVQKLDDIVAGAMMGRRFNAILLAALAVLAVGLALVGVYGVVGYAAAQRTREIAVRIALGANRAHVMMLILTSNIRWAAAGIAAGLLAAYASTRFMARMVVGIQPTDTATFVAAVLFTAAVTFAASVIPARRAAAADPVSALRAD